ncbi:GNAT family N-acetyltransferase [Streptomyces sp. Je 1-369]|uniref:GNAT family N-acetyltransferase n=1 Tax=Streptomyces sp. Je 1-369 TaxID=2966192 RepID=UPI002286345D|nr:GNAT family N-acetyltransferase [Streptomyces sp. Je 1-369]WAM00507.1 GNAT family N-acetyltransferase [Streptomyces sp. Je 1-369]
MRLERLTAAGLRAVAGQLGDLLADTVRGGNSLGFLAGLDRAAASGWWRGLGPDVEAGRLAVWVARDGERGDSRVTGTVSVAFTDKPNGRHRAELAKLMVHPDARGQGLARALLTTAEHAVTQAGVTLLVLDTETGSPAETVYRRAGWTEAGTIPDYAADPSGALHATTLFYKRLGTAARRRLTDAEPERAARQ